MIYLMQGLAYTLIAFGLLGMAKALGVVVTVCQ